MFVTTKQNQECLGRMYQKPKSNKTTMYTHTYLHINEPQHYSQNKNVQITMLNDGKKLSCNILTGWPNTQPFKTMFFKSDICQMLKDTRC